MFKSNQILLVSHTQFTSTELTYIDVEKEMYNIKDRWQKKYELYVEYTYKYCMLYTV